MTFMRDVGLGRTCEWNGAEGAKEEGRETNDRFLLLATMEWRIRANGRTAFHCNIMVLPLPALYGGKSPCTPRCECG